MDVRLPFRAAAAVPAVPTGTERALLEQVAALQLRVAELEGRAPPPFPRSIAPVEVLVDAAEVDRLVRRFRTEGVSGIAMTHAGQAAREQLVTERDRLRHLVFSAGEGTLLAFGELEQRLNGWTRTGLGEALVRDLDRLVRWSGEPWRPGMALRSPRAGQPRYYG